MLEQKRYAWRGRCVIDGANDNEDDDDEDDDHDGDDDENNEYDYSVVVVFVFFCVQKFTQHTAGSMTLRNRGVARKPNNGLHTPRQRDDQRGNIT